MAKVNSGSFTTTSCDGRSLTFNWSVKEQSTSGNYTDINWNLKGSGTSGYVICGNFKVTINGETVYSSSDRINVYNTTTVASGTKRIYHDNNGDKKFSAYAEAGIWYVAVNCSGSGSWELPTIPRYATITQEITSKTETSARIRWTSDKTIDNVWYSIDDGATWVDIGSVEDTSGNYEITGLSADTSYKLKTKIRRKDNQLSTESTALTLTTYNYPYAKETPDFIIGEELSFELYNPLNRTVDVSFIGANDEILSTDSTAMTSVTGYNTETFKNKLYASIPNSISGTYKIKVEYEDIAKTTNRGNTYSVNLDECKPIFEDFTYKDILVADVTGNDQVLIKDKSSLQVTISSVNKMVAQKSATPNKYIVTIDDKNVSANYSEDDVVIDVGSITSAGTIRLKVVAYDSRNNETVVYKDINVYNYTKPVVNVEVTRLNNFEAQTTLKVKGTYDKVTIDNVDRNAITLVEYRYREKEGEWTNWTTIKTTLSNGNFTCNDVILSLDVGKEFDIEVRATDKLDYGLESGSIGIGEAIFFISTNHKACYINNQKISTNVDGKMGKNLFNKNSHVIEGFFINDTGEIAISDKAWYQPSYIEILADTSYIISSDVSTLRVAFYGEDRNFISRVTTTENQLIFITPANAKYLRVSCNTGAEDSLQIELGTVKTDYEEYIDPILSLRDKNGVLNDIPIINRNNLVDLIYPVGSIYMSINNIEPSNIFGGTWEQIKDRFLLSAGDTYEGGSTGGEAEHTLTLAEIPSHQHSLQNNNTNGYSPTWTSHSVSAVDKKGFSGNVRTTFEGGGQPHNNMPPYLAVYMWKRTA